MYDFDRKTFTRGVIVANLKAKIARKEPIILGGAGIGLVAKIEEKSGIDIIMSYSTGPFRMDGNASICGLSSWGDANALTRGLTERILKVVGHTPVVAGVGAADPRRDIVRVVNELMELGASGITNVPGVGALHDMGFREIMDDYGMGYGYECKMIDYCHKKDYFTVAYGYTYDDVRAMAATGVDILGAHVGGTSGGMVGVKTGVMDMDRACEVTQKMCEIAKSENPEVIVVAHGGPIENPDSLQVIFERTDAEGFIGASSIERLPVEREVSAEIKALLSIRTRA